MTLMTNWLQSTCLTNMLLTSALTTLQQKRRIRRIIFKLTSLMASNFISLSFIKWNRPIQHNSPLVSWRVSSWNSWNIMKYKYHRWIPCIPTLPDCGTFRLFGGTWGTRRGWPFITSVFRSWLWATPGPKHPVKDLNEIYILISLPGFLPTEILSSHALASALGNTNVILGGP